jgi:hypothetical protein
MKGRHVIEAAAACQALLAAAADQDWARPIPEMDWTAAEAVSHMAEGTLWYASDLAGARQLEAMELRVPPGMAHADIIRRIGAFATVLARVVDGTPPGTRGRHPMGQADASGFAAMACDELLVHTDDAGRGLGVPYHAAGRAGPGDPGPAVPLDARRRPVAGPAVVRRPHRLPGPAPPGPLALALRPVGGVGWPHPGRPPLTRLRHSSSSIA